MNQRARERPARHSKIKLKGENDLGNEYFRLINYLFSRKCTLFFKTTKYFQRITPGKCMESWGGGSYTWSTHIFGLDVHRGKNFQTIPWLVSTPTCLNDIEKA